MLGVDPGSVSTGFAFLTRRNGLLTALDYGEVRPPRGTALPKRLEIIHAELDRRIRDHAPVGLSLENLFVAKGLQSMMKLVYAKGVILLLAAQHDLPVYEYSALTIKKSVSGYGHAAKHQVQFMVQKLLNLPRMPRADEADAMAMAVCHLHSQIPLQATGALRP